MKHKHHIIPKHMGGTDDPSNLIELTVEEHAEAHRKLYEEYGHIEDKIAWQCLSGRKLSEQDRIALSHSGFKKFLSDENRRNEWIHSISNKRKSQVITEKHKKNISDSMKLAYKEGRKKYVPVDPNFLKDNYERNKDKMTQSRKKSQIWKESVTSEESRNKKRKNSPKSKSVIIDDIEYDSIRQAAKESQYSYSQIRKMLKT